MLTTTVEQSRELAKVLPKESADFVYMPDRALPFSDETLSLTIKSECEPLINWDVDIPAWSLESLLKILPTVSLYRDERSEKWWCDSFPEERCFYQSKLYDEPIDACLDIFWQLAEEKYYEAITDNKDDGKLKFTDFYKAYDKEYSSQELFVKTRRGQDIKGKLYVKVIEQKTSRYWNIYETIYQMIFLTDGDEVNLWLGEVKKQGLFSIVDFEQIVNDILEKKTIKRLR